MQCSLCQEVQELKTTTVALRESQGAKATADVSVDWNNSSMFKTMYSSLPIVILCYKKTYRASLLGLTARYKFNTSINTVANVELVLDQKHQDFYKLALTRPVKANGVFFWPYGSRFRLTETKTVIHTRQDETHGLRARKFKLWAQIV